jgi:hypothetical protein
MALAQHYCVVWGGWYKAQQEYSPVEKSVLNMFWQLISVSDWLIVMIGSGGLLFVVPHLFAVPVSVLLVGLQNSK